MFINILPDLPKKLQKREAKITPLVLKWFQKNFPFSCALEIKATKTNTISKSALKEHQCKALIAVQSMSGLSYKIPDNSRIRLPFDAFQLKGTQSFVVACFLKERICLAIDPKDWEGANSGSDCIFSFPLK